jgi:predicted amidohydrolase YtcJ
MRGSALIVVAASLLAACRQAPPERPADLIVYGRVWTGDTTRPWVRGVAVRGGSIVAVGSKREIGRFQGARTRVLDDGDHSVIPGLGDAHTHFIDGGFQLMSVDLRDADTPAEFIRRIAAFAKRLPRGRWILGGDWDHERWPGSPLPRKEWIDSVTPDNPVFVSRLDGHMGVANSLALRLARVTGASRAPEGGMIVRDTATGAPTGVLKDNARDAIWRVVPQRTAPETDSALAVALRHAAEMGLTTIHVMSSNWSDLAAFRRARARDALTARIYDFVPLATWKTLADTVRADGRGDDWLRIGGLKGFMDGSLGSTTAAFFAPYLDAPSSRGLLVTDSATMRQRILSADSAGLQIAVHAIGDRANAMLLDFYAEAARLHGPRERRFRIEHAQHLRQADLPRFGVMGVIPSMQPYHAIDDGRWAWKRLDTLRLRGTYAFHSLLAAGAPLAFGSDWTVAPLSPLLGIYAAVTRQTLDGKNPGGWFAGEKITLEQALRAYTAGVAFAGFLDGRTGVLRPGMLADIAVLDHDLFATPPDSLNAVRVVATIVGGRIVHGGR